MAVWVNGTEYELLEEIEYPIPLTEFAKFYNIRVPNRRLGDGSFEYLYYKLHERIKEEDQPYSYSLTDTDDNLLSNWPTVRFSGEERPRTEPLPVED